VAFAVSLGELLRLLLAFLQVPGPDRPAPAAQPLHGPEEIFFRMVRFEEFDVAELSLSTYVLTAQRDAPFVAIPVFPSRLPAQRDLHPLGGRHWLAAGPGWGGRSGSPPRPATR
jgi:hypothetical protein